MCPRGRAGTAAREHPEVASGHRLEAHLGCAREQLDRMLHSRDRGEDVVGAADEQGRHAELREVDAAARHVEPAAGEVVAAQEQWYSCPNTRPG